MQASTGTGRPPAFSPKSGVAGSQADVLGLVESGGRLTPPRRRSALSGSQAVSRRPRNRRGRGRATARDTRDSQRLGEPAPTRSKAGFDSSVPCHAALGKRSKPSGSQPGGHRFESGTPYHLYKFMLPSSSGPGHHLVTVETAGSNPVGGAIGQ